MIRIEIDDSELRRAMDTLQRRVGDMTPAMREIGEVLTQSTIDRFKTSTAPDGSRWAPNKPSTRARKKGTRLRRARRSGRGGISDVAARASRPAESPMAAHGPPEHRR